MPFSQCDLCSILLTSNMHRSMQYFIQAVKPEALLKPQDPPTLKAQVCDSLQETSFEMFTRADSKVEQVFPFTPQRGSSEF